ncbi:MAG: glycine--tRNA ligase subunit alpha [Proteobacteria bacterium]|nr:glycine--tRNA ligase subunit alpha [Pseudomonadota bacterium]
MYFQDLIFDLEKYWTEKGCVLSQPYQSEVGAGTFNPATFLYALSRKNWNTCYVETCKRPKDGRYAENPNRMQQFTQYQVILKPAPSDVQDLYLHSLESAGIEIEKHDIRFVEDDWESPTLGASGLGWEVWLDGMEISQFTYFQQLGGIELNIIPVELTYGLERIATFLQGIDSIFDLQIQKGIKWGDLYKESEYEMCVFNFDESNTKMLFEQFENYTKEALRLTEKGLVFPAYDYVIKCSHTFNLLDARGAISPKERGNTILHIRNLSKEVAKLYLEKQVTND